MLKSPPFLPAFFRAAANTVANRPKIFGCALVASSFVFLWVYVLIAFVAAYSLIAGHGTGVDVAGESGVRTLLSPLPAGAALMGSGVYLIMKVGRPSPDAAE